VTRWIYRENLASGNNKVSQRYRTFTALGLTTNRRFLVAVCSLKAGRCSKKTLRLKNESGSHSGTRQREPLRSEQNPERTVANRPGN